LKREEPGKFEYNRDPKANEKRTVILRERKQERITYGGFQKMSI